jgi:hemolysin III
VNISTDRGFEGKPSPRITVGHDLPKQYSTGAADALTKRRLRCWIHIYCTAVAAIAGTTVVIVSWVGASKRAVVLASSEW